MQSLFGVLRLNTLATGNWFRPGMGFKTLHGPDKAPQDPASLAPKGFIFIKTDETQKTGRIAPVVRFLWNQISLRWESNEYPGRQLKFITAETFRKLHNPSVTDIYALGDESGNPVSLGKSPSFTDFQLGLLLGHDATVKLDDPHEDGVVTVEQLDHQSVPPEIIKEMEIADAQPNDSIVAKAIKVDVSGAGYWPVKGSPIVTFSQDGEIPSSSDMGRPLVLPGSSNDLLGPPIVNMVTWAGDYSKPEAKFLLKADPLKTCLYLESKYRPGTCWNLVMPYSSLATLTGSPSGTPVPYSHPCVFDRVDWNEGVIYVWVMTGALNGEPREGMKSYIKWFLPVHHRAVDSSGITVPIPNDILKRNKTVEVQFEHRPTTSKEPIPKSSYICIVRAKIRIADIVESSPMSTFSVSDHALEMLREYSKLNGDPVAL